MCRGRTGLTLHVCGCRGCVERELTGDEGVVGRVDALLLGNVTARLGVNLRSDGNQAGWSISGMSGFF